MTLHDVELDRAYSYRSLIGESGNTAIIELAGGAEERIQRWSDTRLVANLGYAVKSYDDLRDILTFKRARGHRAHSFRFWNPLDYSTNALNTPSDDSAAHVDDEDESIGTGAPPLATFQLVKRYTSGATTVTRNITKPITGTVKVAVATVAQTEGVDFTVNYSTGVVTFGTPPSNGAAVTAGCQFNDEVRFESDDTAVSIESYERGDVPGGLRVVSVFDSTIVNEDFHYRGSSTPTFSASMDLTPQMGAFVRLDPTGAGLELMLPDPTPYPAGGPHWKLRNLSATYTFAVVDSTGTLWTMQVAGDANRRDTCEIWLGYDGAGVLTWQAVT
jgi:uncharacterized protein (TIGR02217 family)